MRFTGHDLRQLDDERLHQLREENPDQLERVSVQLLSDLKEALERLNQSPSNSSRPPSTRDPWSKNGGQDESEGSRTSEDQPVKDEKSDSDSADADSDKKTESNDKSVLALSPRKPGKQPGAPGVARTQSVPVTATIHHYPQHCALCGNALPSELAQCYTGYEVLDLELGSLEHPDVRLTNAQHRFYKIPCPCGHSTCSEPHREPPDTANWNQSSLTEWRLIGPGLAAFLSWLHFRMRLSGRMCRELLIELFGLTLSVGAIQQSFHETARAAEPIYRQLIKSLQDADLIYADETPHKQAGDPLWLWAVLSSTTVIFFIGRRTKELFHSYISPDFAGWLMSDGYRVYREFEQRLRCWAHLIRKAHGLAETYTPHVQGYGLTLLAIFDNMMAHIHQARASPEMALREALSGELDRLRALCEKMARSQNEKARQLGVEFLNDWEAIFRILDHPDFPITNNIAERILRHWVILRRITFGTRTPQGSLALAISASIIETCRLREISPTRYLRQVIAARRAGDHTPALVASASEEPSWAVGA